MANEQRLSAERVGGRSGPSVQDRSCLEVFVAAREPSLQRFLSSALLDAGHQVVTFVDGASVVDAARRRVPDCIILDTALCGPGGLDVLRELNARSYAAPILIVSERDDVASAVEALRDGAADFVQHDPDPALLIRRVQAAVGSWAQAERRAARQAG